jgi:hypothetical protein
MFYPGRHCFEFKVYERRRCTLENATVRQRTMKPGVKSATSTPIPSGLRMFILRFLAGCCQALGLPGRHQQRRRYEEQPLAQLGLQKNRDNAIIFIELEPKCGWA